MDDVDINQINQEAMEYDEVEDQDQMGRGRQNFKTDRN